MSATGVNNMQERSMKGKEDFGRKVPLNLEVRFDSLSPSWVRL